jgi:preprotein translocase subunit SecG
MLALGFMGTVVAIAIIATALLLIGLVLLQKNRGSGLSGAFGGVGGHSAFGTKTGDVLTWITVGLAAAFLVLNITGNFAFRETEDGLSRPDADVAETTGDAAPSGAAPVTVPPKPAKAPADGDAAPFTFTTIPAGKTPPKPADGEPAKPAGG